ncbi:sensor histidine kinase [Flavisolibacter nicotianae]|uniref:sensor histidine kinase n=1 Tax=Flavisolibacter nicotianae TaxID=2364882 RepID=UPI000EAE079D|nr:response regulator [Flavisolibacter nicotianae]
MEALNLDDIKLEKRIKILIVDDRPDNLLSIETILENDNYEIVKAQSGKAALKILLNQHDFTLILMDVQMPDINGLETASLIYQREKLKHIPIIFITAHNYNDEHVFEGYKIGAIDYIYKPINPELLRFKVGVFAEMYQKNHQLLLQEQKLKQMNANLAREIEERRMSEERVRLLNQQLLENNRSLKATIEELDRFAYVASHDLQEPLRKILVFSDKLLSTQRQHVTEDMMRYMEKIMKSSERMQKLINDLLAFSRQEDNAAGFTEVDLNHLVADVLSDMEVEIEKNRAQVKVDSLPTLWANPSGMRQLFQNLISNAIKFRKPEIVPIVSIYCQANDTPMNSEFDTNCRIVVEDNGIGFDEKYAEEIFVVFKRLHSYHEYEGTGVGLSICKKIIDKHQGRISAESENGKGSRFYIDLPLQKSFMKIPDGTLNKLSLEE